MKIHLIGIGGIGVSALAQYYLSKGHKVSGSDLVASEITDFLKEKGIKIFIGNYAKNIEKDFDLVVYSPAVPKNNPELLQATHYKLQTKSYPEALGDLTKEYYTIAVAGAHGKSTTVSMIALALTKAGLDPTVIVGTKIKEFGNSNFRFGSSLTNFALKGLDNKGKLKNIAKLVRDKSKLLVIEACEYDSSFLHYSPKIIVITNVDKEHLDYFKTFTNVKKAFKNFIACLAEAKSEGGCDSFLVFNRDDRNIPRFAKPKFKAIGYSAKQKEFVKIKKILKVPGQHNALNALAVLQVARILGIPDKITFQSLSEFKGTWRRFEIIQPKIEKFKNLKIISDYAHHPNEISATLNAAREKYKNKTIWCIFQPHQHQRTHYLFNDFVKIFRNVPIDKIIIADIYDVAGRETKTINREVNSEKLVKKINKKGVSYCATENLVKEIKENIKSGDVLIIMGAGDIYKLADKF